MIKYLTALCLCFSSLSAAEWISANIALPPVYERTYLFWIDDETIIIADYVDFFLPGGLVCTDGDDWYIATKWMELPE